MLKIKNLDLGIREKLDVLVLDVTEATTKGGKPYVIFTVTDGEATVKIRKWDCVATDYERAKNTVVEMNVKSSMYNGEITYDTDFAVFSKKPMDEFIKKVPGDIQKMMDEILERVSRIADAELRSMVENILLQEKDRLLYWAAAKSHHHALYGGLLYHMYRMGKNADMQCDLYPNLDRDILVAGAYLHDIGKLIELDTNKLGNADYTTEGSLLGHIYIGMEYLEKNQGTVDQKKLLHLKHMIASHHGCPEWGALMAPKTAEAQMLHFLDMIDSRMYMFEDTYKTMESDTIVKTPSGSVYKF